MGFFSELGKAAKAIKAGLEKDTQEINKYFEEGKEMEYTELVRLWEMTSSDSEKEGYGKAIKQRTAQYANNMEYDKLITLYKNSEISPEKDGYEKLIRRKIKQKINNMEYNNGLEYSKLRALYLSSTIPPEKKVYEKFIKNRIVQGIRDGEFSHKDIFDMYFSWDATPYEKELCRNFLCNNGYLDKKTYSRTGKRPTE